MIETQKRSIAGRGMVHAEANTGIMAYWRHSRRASDLDRAEFVAAQQHRAG
jgi:hypothetical protein